MSPGLRRAVVFALACASLPLAAAEPATATATTPTPVAAPPLALVPPAPAPVAPAAVAPAPAFDPAADASGPLVPLALPLAPPAPAVESPVTGNTVMTAEPLSPPAPADGSSATAIVPAEPGTFAPARPLLAMTTGEETFARLRSNLSPKSCDAGSNSARWRQRYAGSPANFSRRLQNVLPLLDFVSVEVERSGLPAEFTFIPLVESWFQPAAIGPGGPAGMWQMIASTARNHGIHIREGYDGRLSPVESTRAALSYLKVLQDMFGGDWQAIVMAYNAGEGRMQHAMRRAGSRVTSAAERRPHGLSNITYDYVAKLQALSCLVSQPHRYGLRLPVEARFEPLVPLQMDPGIQSLDAFARARGKDPEELKRLNPGFRNGRVVAGVPRLVLAPPGASLQAPKPATMMLVAWDPMAATDLEGESEIAELLEVALADATGDEAALAATTEFIPEVVSSAAEAPVATLAAVAVADVARPETALEQAQRAPAPIAAAGFTDPPPPVHEVREGESLWSIAKYYQLPIEQIRKANGLDRKATVHPGQVLRLVP